MNRKIENLVVLSTCAYVAHATGLLERLRAAASEELDLRAAARVKRKNLPEDDARLCSWHDCETHEDDA